MSTSATISVFDGDYYHTIYNHANGSPEHLGAILTEYYPTIEQAMDLIDLGDASTIESTLALSTFYCRDRGEPRMGTRARITDIAPDCDETYHYILKEDGKWSCTDMMGRRQRLGKTPLDKLLKAIQDWHVNSTGPVTELTQDIEEYKRNG